jgi:hypothetical protein
MQAPAPATIVKRAILVIALLVSILYGFGFIKKKQRLNALITESQTLATDSSFFHQFYQEDARKTLVRAVGLIAAANELGMTPATFIDRTLGYEKEFLTSTVDRDEDPRQILIRKTLASNYDNFRKLGYTADFHTLAQMSEGKLPAIPSGPMAGSMAVVVPIIDPALLPGLEKVVANLQIRPPAEDGEQRSDVEIAASKKLVEELTYAGIIETKARDRIIGEITSTKPEKPADDAATSEN